MTPTGTQPKRERDAETARQAILDAAEQIFSENGFDGARVDAIAAASGYNKSLIFHYFGDKLGLYAEVVKRADREMTELQERVLTPLFEDETIPTNAQAFKALLETIVAAIFDYLVEHPRFIRTVLWEQAEGWQTYSKLISQLATEDVDQFETLFRKAYSAGLLRSDFVTSIQLTMVLQICLSYLTFIPLYQMALFPGEDLFSAAALARAREYIVSFVVHGMMTDLPETKP
ncbi:MAG: TetR/AcrR family transcriptional regulator [Ktedonobacteraceae bacterium]